MDHVGPHGLDEPGVLMQITDVVSPSGFMWRHPAWLIIGLLAAALAVAAQVEFPQPPDTARMWMRVALDPIPISARVVCSAPDRSGIRRASVVASSPPWVNVRLDRLEQSPELCVSPALAPRAPPRLAFRRIVGRPGW